MKKLNKFLLLFGTISLFSLYACIEKGNLVFTIEGDVFDMSSNQAMQSGTMKLYRVPAATTNEILIEETEVVNGRYSFTFPRDMSEKYVIKFFKDDYFEESKSLFFSELEVDVPYELDFTAEQIASMNWVLIDQSPGNPSNYVIIQKLTGRNDYQGCPNQQYEYHGGASNDTLKCSVGGNQYIKFYIINLPDYTLDSVYCNTFEDNYYYVNF